MGGERISTAPPTIESLEDELRYVHRLIIGAEKADPEKEGVDGLFHNLRCAQALLINHLTVAETSRKELEKRQKEARQAHNQQLSREIGHSIERVELLEWCIRSLADSIVWGVLDLEKRGKLPLHEGREPVQITSIDVDGYLEAIEELSEWFDHSFGLVTDLTGLIQIGDALFLGLRGDEAHLIFIEEKAGPVNYEIDEILRAPDTDTSTIMEDDSDLTQRVRERFGAKGVDQARRNYQQFRRAMVNVRTWKLEEGEISVAGESVPSFVYGKPRGASYQSELAAAIKSAREGTVERFVIDGCVYVQVSVSEAADPEAFVEWLEEEADEPGAAGFFRYSVTHPHTVPPFLLGLSEDDLFDVLTGRLHVVMAVDLAGLTETLNANGLSAVYESSHRVEMARQADPTGGLLKGPRSQGIVIEHEEATFAAGGGVLARILFELLRPAEVAELLKVPTAELERVQGALGDSDAPEQGPS